MFKLSQLIIEHLLYCQDVLQEKYQKLVEKCNDLEAEKTTQAKELQALKDTLASAKKELRRRKELLATAQSEIIGDNKDEYDPVLKSFSALNAYVFDIRFLMIF